MNYNNNYLNGLTGYNTNIPMNDPNVFSGVYVANENEVASAPVPSDGSPMVLMCPAKNMCWVKRMGNNGIPTVSPYQLVPMFKVVDTEPEKPIDTNALLADMLNEMKTMRNEINTMKAGEYNVRTNVNDATTEK